MSRVLLGSTNGIFMIAIYLPSEKSPRNEDNESGIELLENLTIDLKRDYSDYSILIICDLNVRTGMMQDYILDDAVKFINDIDQWYTSTPSSDFSVPRNSKDDIVNSFELWLIDLCCEFDVQILNGRHPNDLEGNFTYVSSTGCSVIYYVICSPDIITRIRGFNIETYDVSSHMPLN